MFCKCNFIYVFLIALTDCCGSYKIIDFSLPIYDKQGQKQVDIKGKKLDISNDKIYYVNDIFIKTDNFELPIASLELKTPAAEIYLPEHVIKGQDEISVNGQGFSFSGHNWELFFDTKNITINNGVKFSFPADAFSVNIDQLASNNISKNDHNNELFNASEKANLQSHTDSNQEKIDQQKSNCIITHSPDTNMTGNSQEAKNGET